MRIAVNTRLLIKNKLDGIGWFSFETLKRMTIQHPEHQFLFFFDRAYDQEFVFGNNIIPIVIGQPARHPVLWYIWFEYYVFRALKKYNADLFLSPDGFLSLRTKVPSIAVIHDINFFHRPEDLPFLSRLYYNYFFPRFAKKAIRICTVSGYSRDEIAASYHISPSKIEVHYNGANKDFRPIDGDQKNMVRKQFTGGKPYFIFIGNIHPRKNLVNLLKAFDHFRGLSGKEFKMMIVGEKVFMNKELERIYSGMVYRPDVIFTGHLDTHILKDVLAAAEALTFVPYYEGFGIPVLEAMFCDVPVITSEAASLPEVAGDAALYADPSDYHSICDAMKMLVFSPRIRNELIEKGRLRRQQFSWDKTAEGLWNTIENLGL
jgi:glycosyltransferase involved in cell wall biosynthesis